jgi:hypothetical protein
MKKLIFNWWQNKRQPKVENTTPTCGCEGKKLYDCDVFYMNKHEPIFMKLCINHVGEKVKEGCVIGL